MLAGAMLASAMAGCTSPPALEDAAPEALAPEAAPAAEDMAAAASASSATEEQGEFARTLEEKFHTHNYWGGSLERLLLDADVQSAPAVVQGPFGLFATLFRVGFSRGLGLTPVELPEGSIVPPETSRVEVAITWAQSPTITGIRLAYQTAQGKDIEVLDPVPEGGGTYTIPTTLEQNDMPHTSVSKWRLFLLPHAEQGPGVFNGTVHMTVKVFREDTLFLAPPHPDHWGDRATQALFQHNATLKGTRVVFPVGTGEDDTGFVVVAPPNGTIIPPHTGLLLVTLEWTNKATAPDPFRIRPDLVYTPSNTRRSFPPEGQQVEPGKAV